MHKYLLAAMVALSPAAVSAQEEDAVRPAIHGAATNGGLADVAVTVVGCQGFALPGCRVVLVGVAFADVGADGVARLPDVPPGDYRLVVYGDVGTAYDGRFVVSEAAARIEAEVTLDLCIETELTAVGGTVRRADGKPARGVAVAVNDLFLETETDGKGYYELLVPPGEWTITAYDEEGAPAAAAAVMATLPEDEGYLQTKTVDLQFE